ncbi:MAG: lysophospholipid acyltransferase family protein [Pseudomonadota bacterium]
MPYRLIVHTGRLLGWCFYLASRRDRKIARRNIEACFPELDQRAQKRLTRESLVQLGSNAIEGLWVWTHPPYEILGQVIRVEGHERVTRTLDSGRGVIIMIAHLGQWEVLATYLGHHFRGTFLARSFGKPALDRLVTEGRESAGGHVEYVSRSGLKNIYQTATEGGLVAMLTDQQPERRHGVFAPFFNVPALTTVLIQDLAAQTGAEVITATMLRRPGGGYELCFGEPQPGLDSDDKITAASALNQTYENMIRLCPEQYSWNYKRFKRRPNPGEKPFYD